MRIKTDKLTMLTVTYVAVCFVLSGVSGTALQSITYAMIPDRPIDVIYAGAPAINLYNRSTLTIVECAGICEGDAACGGFNYCEISGDTTCETLEASTDPIDPTILWWRAGCFYYYKQVSNESHPCYHALAIETSFHHTVIMVLLVKRLQMFALIKPGIEFSTAHISI